ncbi:HAD family hydrolase [Asticcacaulis benevestitus]|uniref:HAD family hydrolase n=1 Tax=Asticcacaulis benevestitus DSM 16100 = ATCC BAA-896 TaxID=1121022 RepID=V4P3Z4_9CAUL|nr:HAD-IA family hydrolase [Asticcacaulis benevestitus]ESQ88662.1 hypothetical protein ABENE_15585 [Asticcacaulis benevestitus DSM 16100 = ATCC BAA-896]
MSLPKAFLFDMDGTLCNTEPLHMAAYQTLLQENGRVVDQETFDHQFAGQTTSAVIAHLFPHMSDDMRKDLVALKEARFRETVGRLAPLPGLLEYLDAIAASSATLALVTNAPRADVDCVLAVLGIQTRFSVVIIASELAHPKPHPLPYLRALYEAGVTAKEAVVFEDSIAGLRSARSAGVQTVGVRTTLDAQQLLGSGAWLTIADYHDPALVREGLWPTQTERSGGVAQHISPEY